MAYHEEDLERLIIREICEGCCYFDIISLDCIANKVIYRDYFTKCCKFFEGKKREHK